MENRSPNFYKKILVPLDGTRFAESLISHAVSLASAFSADVHLLRAVPFPSYIFTPPGVIYAGAMPIYRPAVIENEDAWEEDKKGAQAYLDTVEARFREEGLGVSSNVRFGAAHEIILEEAQARHCDLILVASHQRQGLSRWLAPSTSTTLCLQAKCPVMVVPGDESEGRFGEKQLFQELHEQVLSHLEELSKETEIEPETLKKAIPSALTMILAALAEERRRGPDLVEILTEHESPSDGRPDLKLVSLIFNRRGVLATATLKEEIEELESDQSLELLARLSPFVLAYLRATAHDESDVRTFIDRQLANSPETVRETAKKTSELVHV